MASAIRNLSLSSPHFTPLCGKGARLVGAMAAAAELGTMYHARVRRKLVE